MTTFKEFLQEETIEERYLNLFDGDPRKEKYKDQVHAIIQTSYKNNAQADFATPDLCVKNAPFWKLNVKDGVVKSVNFYKDSNGRKRIASGSDGSEEGKRYMLNNPTKEFDRSYVEISGASLAFLMRNKPDAAKYAMPIEKVKETLVGKEILPADHNSTEWEKYPHLRPFFYSRKIGGLDGKPHTKIMFGTTGIPITILKKI